MTIEYFFYERINFRDVDLLQESFNGNLTTPPLHFHYERFWQTKEDHNFPNNPSCSRILHRIKQVWTISSLTSTNSSKLPNYVKIFIIFSFPTAESDVKTSNSCINYQCIAVTDKDKLDPNMLSADADSCDWGTKHMILRGINRGRWHELPHGNSRVTNYRYIFVASHWGLGSIRGLRKRSRDSRWGRKEAWLCIHRL